MGHRVEIPRTIDVRGQMRSSPWIHCESYQRENCKKGRARLDGARLVVERTTRLQASRKARATVIGGKAIPMATYGSSVNLLPANPANSVGNKVLGVLWGTAFGMRAQAMVWSAILEPWTLHPYWASIDTCFREIVRTSVKTPSFKAKLLEVIRIRTETPGISVAAGPAQNLRNAAAAIGYRVDKHGILSSPGDKEIPLFDQDPRWVTNQIRDAIRRTITRNLSARCDPAMSDRKVCREDMEGIPERLDLGATNRLLKCPPPRKNTQQRAIQ